MATLFTAYLLFFHIRNVIRPSTPQCSFRDLFIKDGREEENELYKFREESQDVGLMLQKRVSLFEIILHLALDLDEKRKKGTYVK